MSKVTESPRGACVLGGINDVLGAVDRFCPIYHSGPGCCMQTTAGEHSNSPFVSAVSIPCTNMLEKDVVFGAEEKLRSTIDGAIEIIDAEAYFVLVGCTAGIIGEDVESVAADYRAQGKRVYAIDTPGFQGDGLLGYEIAFKAFLDNIVEKDLPKRKRLVNLLGIIPYRDPFWSGNFEELTRILRKLGLEVNTFFTEHQGFENIRTSSQAELNIIVNPYLLKSAAERYESEFGVPYLRYPGFPIGATDTTEFIRQVAEKLSLDSELVERVIAEEEDYVYSYLSYKGESLGWNRFAVVGDSASAIGITRYLANDASQTPLAVVITEPMYRPEDKQRIIDSITDLEYAKPPEIFFESDYSNIIEKLDKFPDIDMLIGSSSEREYCAKHGIFGCVMTFPIYDRTIINRGIVGYRGSLTLTEDLYNFN
ncbi:MAG: nitrogen fixation protein NifK [Ruminococcus sp.]|nr:nitrogen fixation protein NifK [Ruminococcus sp.]